MGIAKLALHGNGNRNGSMAIDEGNENSTFSSASFSMHVRFAHQSVNLTIRLHNDRHK